MTKVAIVILNWNGEKFLKQFLPAVVKFSSNDLNEIWVADNGSTDNSISFIEDQYPSIRLLKFDKNYGFTEGYNKALSQIDAEYYVLLNSDVEVTENWLNPVIDYMDKNSNTGAAMPKILSYSDKQKFEYAGAAGGFIDKFGYPFCRGRILSETETDEGQYDDAVNIFWATGACMFVRASVFHEIGQLDTDFFAHMEEIDLCWRMKNRGYNIKYIPDSTVYHVGGGTLPNNNPRKLFLNYRNSLFLLYKNLPSGKFRKIMFARMILDGASAIMYILQGKFSFFLAVPKAHYQFYYNLKKYRKKRIENNEKRTVNDHPEIFNRSIVYYFFIKKIRKYSNLKK
jgi:GT2 family glycosyltransferase